MKISHALGLVHMYPFHSFLKTQIFYELAFRPHESDENRHQKRSGKFWKRWFPIDVKEDEDRLKFAKMKLNITVSDLARNLKNASL